MPSVAQLPFDPHLEKLAEDHGIVFWRVDGRSIRDKLDIEFTAYAHWLTHPYIPNREVWVDREAPVVRDPEWLAWSARAYHEIASLTNGISYDDAYVNGVTTENALRSTWRQEQDLNSLYVDSMESEKGLEVILVRGKIVRDWYYVDFIQGGHPLVYSFVPRGEIWIDDALVEEERHFVMAHEVYEFFKMARGMRYDEAHQAASAYELKFRRGGKELNGVYR